MSSRLTEDDEQAASPMKSAILAGSVDEAAQVRGKLNPLSSQRLSAEDLLTGCTGQHGRWMMEQSLEHRASRRRDVEPHGGCLRRPQCHPHTRGLPTIPISAHPHQ